MTLWSRLEDAVSVNELKKKMTAALGLLLVPR